MRSDSLRHAHNCLVPRLPRARCQQMLATLRAVTRAKSQVIQLNMPITVSCGGCLVRVVVRRCRRCVQPEMRMSRAGCRQWLVTLRPVRGAKSEVIHPDMPIIVFCGDCLLRVVGRTPTSLTNGRKISMMHEPQSLNSKFQSGIH